jgi:hypothetical protein
VKRRAVADYLTGVVVYRCNETVARLASRLGPKDQVVPDDPRRFQIGCAGRLFLLLLKPKLFLGCIGAGAGSILGLGHGAFKRSPNP